MSSYNLELRHEIFCNFLLFINNNINKLYNAGLYSLVGIAARYSLDDLGIEYRFFASVQTGTGTHSISYKTGTGLFPGVKRSEPVVNHPSPSATEFRKK